MMKTHFSEADLLETYYMQPGESMPVMMHLASCEVCAARYDALERKLREAAACSTTDKHETFWTRQRMMIQRRIAGSRERANARMQVTRVAAAAVLAFFLGGVFVYRSVEPQHITTVTTTAAAQQPQPMLEEPPLPHDPWQSEELSDFHSVVQWETWGPAETNARKKL
jgi:predicted anti-sigma-YlaC factor YlaD